MKHPNFMKHPWRFEVRRGNTVYQVASSTTVGFVVVSRFNSDGRLDVPVPLQLMVAFAKEWATEQMREFFASRVDS